ncbi:MAG: amidohydrolase [Caulobacteraceae bacterium]|nr:amidohydrolase [Caulobacteraceae bacterium]
MATMLDQGPIGGAELAGISRRGAVLAAAGVGACCAPANSATAASHAHTALPNEARAQPAPGPDAKGRGHGSSPIKIDIYNHVTPPAYLELIKARYSNAGMVKRIANIRNLWDMESRIQLLEKFPEVQQVLTLATPPPEMVAGPSESPDLARIANDGMAEICARYPKKFPAFVAAMPMNNIPAAIKEMDRAIDKLGARGIEIKTNVNGRPLDEPEFYPIFEHATRVHGVPIWMHPERPAAMTDYASESKSRYEIWQVMGWPYETTAAMARIVFSGILDRLPDLRIVTHHCGGMLPYFAGRAETLWAQLGSRTADEDYSGVLKGLKKPFMDYFRMFYGDTVLGGSASALRCGLDFFGPDHVVFASDCPFDPEGGPMFIREGIRSIESLDLSDEVKAKIYVENAQRLLKSIKRQA